MEGLRLATRGSDLATTQSGWVASLLEVATGVSSELEIVFTLGDRHTDVSLEAVGSVGIFTKEVQEAVLHGRADYAVHSLKDLPASQASGLVLAAVPQREDTRDWLLVRPEFYVSDATSFLPLQRGARVGTSAARRLAFLRYFAPDSEACLLRGNVPTRVAKLAAGEYDAILLAGAGLRRLDLDLSGFQVEKLDPLVWPGAPGQGALAIECRSDDASTLALLATLHHPASAEGVDAERSLLRALGGGCSLPLGVTAVCGEQELRLVAALGPTEEELPQDPNRGIPFPPLFRADVRGARIVDLVDAALQALCRREEV